MTLIGLYARLRTNFMNYQGANSWVRFIKYLKIKKSHIKHFKLHRPRIEKNENNFSLFYFLNCNLLNDSNFGWKQFSRTFFDNRLNLFIVNKAKQILLCLSAHKCIKELHATRSMCNYSAPHGMSSYPTVEQQQVLHWI